MEDSDFQRNNPRSKNTESLGESGQYTSSITIPGTPFTDAIFVIREASYTLACYLQDEFEFDPPSPFSKSGTTFKGPFTILELGSGTGVVAANLSVILSAERGPNSEVPFEFDAYHAIDEGARFI